MCGGPILADSGAEQWVVACSLDRLTERGIVCVQVEGADLILVRDGERIHAFERACPHEQADLGQGHVSDGRLFCPRHQASFDLFDGAITPGWPSRDLRRYALRIEGGQIWIDAAAVRSTAGTRSR
jgi:3-phenylpropionate/trans-cinnamate dioxygenase ferredoxin component